MSSSEQNQSDVLAVIAAERAAWNDLVSAVGPDRMQEPGPMGEWSFKDLAAHLTGWRKRSIARLEAASRGEEEPPPPWPADLTDVDDINDWIQEQAANQPVAETLAAEDASYADLSAAVQALPADVLWDSDRFPWLEGQSIGQAILDRSYFDHLHDEHESDVLAWLNRGG
jgi:hypothetical protein